MSTKILVVDDEADVELLMQQRFRRKIMAGTYQMKFASNGRHALTILRAEPDFDVLLLDINMPEIDGLTLLSLLPDVLPHGRAIMVTAYGDMGNIRIAMNRGAFDFVCKPINFSDLEATIEKTAQHVLQLREHRQVKELSELKTRFFDNITHEFRTPLTLIMSPVERLLQLHTDSGLVKDLLSIDRNARHLLRLINQLLELAKLEAGHMQVHAGPGDLAAFTDQLVQAFQPLAQQKRLDLMYHTNVTGNWLFDEEKLGQVIYNLIANAIKFTSSPPESDGGGKGRISVLLEAGSTLKLTVSDTGTGIPDAALPYIFDRFYQASPQNTKLSGTGIGLSLVKELIELMNGRLTVNSHAGDGAAFTVELPLAPVPGEPATVEKTAHFWDWFPKEEHRLSVQSAPDNSDASLILLVDDNEELITYLTDTLVPYYRVITACTGEQGWQLAQAELPDIVISDVMMEAMDGYTLAHLIKTTPATDHIAVMLLTAKAAYDNRLFGLQQGADDYLTKPFHCEELLLRLHNLLTRQQRLRNFFGQQLARLELPHPAETLQEGWLKTLYQTLETHIDDPALSVEWLAARMAMSRKTLLRKVQALTKLSPNELIRQYRLRKAADLLRQGHSVADAAYMVGFETPAYFGQCFKELYNVTPGKFSDLATR